VNALKKMIRLNDRSEIEAGLTGVSGAQTIKLPIAKNPFAIKKRKT
jgi:hypothetical protein